MSGVPQKKLFQLEESLLHLGQAEEGEGGEEQGGRGGEGGQEKEGQEGAGGEGGDETVRRVPGQQEHPCLWPGGQQEEELPHHQGCFFSTGAVFSVQFFGVLGLSQLNKDHQRIMVDPMFMIVQNLRLFLTAVTPTAVAPTADQFRLYSTILNHIEPY